MPILEEDGRIDIKSARHPLIDKEKVVATNINLGYTFDSLIITGPNTGGKTVSIKTIGLFCLMASCGLMIPCNEGSKLSFFKQILVDIGDEQSIEHNLSTFSSHMVNIIKIIEKADNNSLVLIDELGAGTDPLEGAALATAIIEALRIKNVRLAATTHYAELKEYALKTNGVENACCEFDVTTLSPTYNLLIGMPGKSNAFAISKRLGMRYDIVERAKNLVSSESTEFEGLVTKLEESRSQLEKEKKEANILKNEAEKLLKEAQELKEKTEKDTARAVETARQQASMIVSKTKAHADSIIDEVEKLKKEKDKILSAQEKLKLKQGLKTLEDSSNPVVAKKDDNYKLPRELKIGDNVLIYDIGKDAIVTEIRGKQISVIAGVIKTRVNISNLRLLEKKKEQKQKSNARNIQKALNMEVAKMDIDIRGMTCDEGIMELDSYLDRAVRQNLNQVTIIHGKGTGVLRTAVQTHLKRHPNIRTYRFGNFGEGEMGVTIAELK
ncbi:MAG: Smr/MutS family protein [Clostridia bacterium]